MNKLTSLDNFFLKLYIFEMSRQEDIKLDSSLIK